MSVVNRHRPGVRAERNESTGPVVPTTTATSPSVSERTPVTEAPAPSGVPKPAGFDGGALPAARLNAELQKASTVVAEIRRAPLPTNLDALADTYARLGQAVARIQACLINALDALDPKSHGGVANPAAPYAQIKARAFAELRETGVAFAGLEPAYGKLVHGEKGWPPRPVVKAPDRGDGKPLVVYENTFKKNGDLSDEQRQVEYDKRVQKFVGAGGRFDDILVGKPGVFDGMTANVRYDYVMTATGTLRMFPNDRDDDSGPPKPGHSLLAVGGKTFEDQPALLAGEILILKDSQGDVEAVLVANNSGHFKPTFDDLPNAIPVLTRLGIPAEKIVLCGGPNNLFAMFREIGGKLNRDLSSHLPPAPTEILDELRTAPSPSVFSVRLGR